MGQGLGVEVREDQVKAHLRPEGLDPPMKELQAACGLVEGEVFLRRLKRVGVGIEGDDPLRPEHSRSDREDPGPCSHI